MLRQQDVRRRTDLHADALALQVGEASEREGRRRHHRVAHLQETLGALQPAHLVIGIGRQREDGVAAVLQDRVAQGPPLVVGQPPDVFDRRAEPLADQFGKLDVETAFRSFGLAERQVVGVGADAQRFGTRRRHGKSAGDGRRDGKRLDAANQHFETSSAAHQPTPPSSHRGSGSAGPPAAPPRGEAPKAPPGWFNSCAKTKSVPPSGLAATIFSPMCRRRRDRRSGPTPPRRTACRRASR